MRGLNHFLLLLLVPALADGAEFNVGCGGDVSEPTTITTPNYPNPYGVSQACEWTVSPRGDTSFIKLTFRDFDLDSSDSLAVFYENGTEFKTFTGFATNAVFTFFADFPSRVEEVNDGAIRLRFESDASVVRRGFRVDVSWSECPKAKKCPNANGEVENVRDSDNCDQCVCEGCPPVECPDYCTYGDSNVKRYGYNVDCEKCFCKAPTCAELGCRTVPSDQADGSSVNDFLCQCKNKIVGEGGTFGERNRYANFLIPFITINGQRRLICTQIFETRNITLGGLSRAFCNQAGIVEEDFRDSATIFFGLDFALGLGSEFDRELAFNLKGDCDFVEGSSDFGDYADCFDDEPITVEECFNRGLVQGIYGTWCTFENGFFPSFRLGGGRRQKRSAGQEMSGSDGSSPVMVETIALMPNGTIVKETQTLADEMATPDN